MAGWQNDFANGFNSMSRQKMLDSHCLLFPEGTTVFNFFYGTDSPVFLFDADNDIITLQSSQGSRQGCAAGTHGFCLGLHPMMSELQSLFPEFALRVLTDDVCSRATLPDLTLIGSSPILVTPIFLLLWNVCLSNMQVCH
jgi:hypothetical protein